MTMLMRSACVLLLLACPLGMAPASAQPADSRVEVGGHISVLRIGESNGTNVGVGGRVSFDLIDWAAAEAEFICFPDDTIETEVSMTPVPGLRFAYHRRRSEALFGVKLGQRFKHFGVFAKVRPGFTRLIDQGIECLGEICTRVTVPTAIARPNYRTELVFDFGGILEFYPSARTVARFELGDLLIRNESTAPPCPAVRCTTHNVASAFGIGFRVVRRHLPRLRIAQYDTEPPIDRHNQRGDVMPLKLMTCVCFCIVMTSAVSTGQQRSETTNQAQVLAPGRQLQTRSESDGREVVVETFEAPDIEGRWAPIQEIVMETIRTPNTARTTRDVFEFAADRRGRLLERTESLREALANGDTSVVHSTWAPDLNGRLLLASRQIEQTSSTGADVHQTETVFLLPRLNGALLETERTEYTERRLNPGTVLYDRTHLVRDVNGRWQSMEIRRGEAWEIGATERMEEETIQRPDINGKLAINERSIIRRFKANDQDHVVIETYAPYADGFLRSNRVAALSQRLRRTTTSNPDGGRYVVEEVEGRNPVAPNAPMQVIRRTETTVRQIGPDRWVTARQMFERDVNGRLQLVK